MLQTQWLTLNLLLSGPKCKNAFLLIWKPHLILYKLAFVSAVWFVLRSWFVHFYRCICGIYVHTYVLEHLCVYVHVWLEVNFKYLSLSFPTLFCGIRSLTEPGPHWLVWTGWTASAWDLPPTPVPRMKSLWWHTEHIILIHSSGSQFILLKEDLGRWYGSVCRGACSHAYELIPKFHTVAELTSESCPPACTHAQTYTQRHTHTLRHTHTHKITY